MDVFLSYAAEDRRKIAILVGLLEELGLSVWWDRDIDAGAKWSDVIESELVASRCVIVAWSRSSMGSGWVAKEAALGRERGVLIPVLLEPVQPPNDFATIQAARLTAWTGTRDSAELAKLLQRVAGFLGIPCTLAEGELAKAVEEFDRIEVIEAVFEYCALFFAFTRDRNESAGQRLTPAYEALERVAAPISAEDLHEMLERFLGEFAAQPGAAGDAPQAARP